MGLFRPFQRSSRPGDDRSRRGRAVNTEFLHERLPHSKLGFVDAGHFAYELEPMITAAYDARTAKSWLFATDSRLDDKAPIGLLGQRPSRSNSGRSSAQPGNW